MDISFNSEEGTFKYRVVGVLIDEDNRVLIQRVADNEFYCLPGGRVELGESSKEAVCRELQEELGFEVSVEKPLFNLENFFSRADGSMVHEIGVFFQVSSKVSPKEDWEIVENDKGVLKTLRYKWVKLSELEKVDVRPAFLKEKLLNMGDRFEQLIIREGNEEK